MVDAYGSKYTIEVEKKTVKLNNEAQEIPLHELAEANSWGS